MLGVVLGRVMASFPLALEMVRRALKQMCWDWGSRAFVRTLCGVQGRSWGQGTRLGGI